MLSKKELAIGVITIMSVLLESGVGTPKSPIQMALGEQIEGFQDPFKFNILCGVLESQGWVKVTPNTLDLTTAGFEKANEFEAMREVNDVG